MAGMENDQPHAAADPGTDFLHQSVIHPVMGAVTPPDEDVGIVQHFIRQSLCRHIKSGCADFKIIGGEVIFQTLVNPLRIRLADIIAQCTLFLFVNVFVPDSDFDLAHNNLLNIVMTHCLRVIYTLNPGMQT